VAGKSLLQIAPEAPGALRIIPPAPSASADGQPDPGDTA